MIGSDVTCRKTDWRVWSGALLVSIGVHAGIYHHYAGLSSNVRPPDTPPRVMLSLVAAPVVASTPEPAPPPVAPAEPPEPVVETPPPKPRPEPKRVVKPSPKPKRVEQPPAPPEPRVLPQLIASAEPPAAGPPVTAELPFAPPRANAAYLKNTPPRYPKMLLRRGVEGTVLLSAQVMDDGRCNEVRIKESSGFDLFDEAALRAVKSWRFVPARKGTEAVVAWVEVPIAFEITRTQ